MEGLMGPIWITRSRAGREIKANQARQVLLKTVPNPCCGRQVTRTGGQFHRQGLLFFGFKAQHVQRAFQVMRMASQCGGILGLRGRLDGRNIMRKLRHAGLPKRMVKRG